MLPPSSTSLTFLGAGRMAKALIQGLINAHLVVGQKISVSSKNGTSAQALAQEYDLQAVSNNDQAIMASPVIFLCMKPAQVLETLTASASLLKDKLIISVVAGISSEDLFIAAGRHARIIRTMPNTAVRLGKGATTIAHHPSATTDDLLLAKKLFNAVGTAYEIEESQINATTAVSGSGPAFALLFLEALMQGGIDEGLDPLLARALAAHAMAAAAALILETEDSPEVLRAEIASPKGTTEAGLISLQQAAFLTITKAAVHAAAQRSRELALAK